MKNVKFIILILTLVAFSVCFLASLMHLVSDTEEGLKDYLLSEQSFDFNNNHISEEAPTPQEILAEKFQSMYEIDEQENTITVISKKYLEEYWESNYGKNEEIKSLSVDEILFIIQDSIKIYEKYDKVILQGYESKLKYGNASIRAEFDRRYPKSNDYCWDGDETEKFWRVPYIQTETIQPIDGYDMEQRKNDVQWAMDTVSKDVQKIIFYRIEALSSPKVFIQKAELLCLVGEDPREFSSKTPEQLYYCAGMNNANQRQEVLEALKNDYYRSAISPVDCGEIDLLNMAGDYYSNREVNLSSPLSIKIYNGVYQNEVFLTNETEEEIKKYLKDTYSITYLIDWDVKEEGNDAWIKLLPKTKDFICSRELSSISGGKYTPKDGVIILEARGNTYDAIYILKETGNGMTVLYSDSYVELLPNVKIQRQEPDIQW